MAVVVIQELSGVPMRIVKEVSEELNVGADPPEGLIVHTGVETDGGTRIVDVWESRETFERFRPRVQAAVAAVAQRNGIEARPPVTEFFDTFEVVRGGA